MTFSARLCRAFLFYMQKITGISAAQLVRLQKLIDEGRPQAFYSWRSWRDHIRPQVLKLDRFECYYCRKPLNHGRAIVHHVQHLTQAPELALSIYTPAGERQLVSCCKACHEARHPEALRLEIRKPAEPLTAERWD